MVLSWSWECERISVLWLGLLMTAFNKRSHSGLNDGMPTDLQGTTASEAYYELFSVCGDLTARKRNRTTEALETRVFLKVNSSVLKEL